MAGGCRALRLRELRQLPLGARRRAAQGVRRPAVRGCAGCDRDRVHSGRGTRAAAGGLAGPAAPSAGQDAGRRGRGRHPRWQQLRHRGARRRASRCSCCPSRPTSSREPRPSKRPGWGWRSRRTKPSAAELRQALENLLDRSAIDEELLARVVADQRAEPGPERAYRSLMSDATVADASPDGAAVALHERRVRLVLRARPRSLRGGAGRRRARDDAAERAPSMRRVREVPRGILVAPPAKAGVLSPVPLPGASCRDVDAGARAVDRGRSRSSPARRRPRTGRSRPVRASGRRCRAGGRGSTCGAATMAARRASGSGRVSASPRTTTSSGSSSDGHREVAAESQVEHRVRRVDRRERERLPSLGRLAPRGPARAGAILRYEPSGRSFRGSPATTSSYDVSIASSSSSSGMPPAVLSTFHPDRPM